MSEWLTSGALETMLWLVLVLLSLTQPADQKLFRLEKLGPEYYRFLNHGFKAGQVTREQAKLKVDILGKVLKKHVTQLRTGMYLITIFQYFSISFFLPFWGLILLTS